MSSLCYGVLAVLFSMSLYESVFLFSAIAVKGWGIVIWPFLALTGWILLGLREIAFSRPPEMAMALYALYGSSMLMWIAAGFEINERQELGFSVLGEVFNVVTKAALPLGYAIHLGSGRRRAHP